MTDQELREQWKRCEEWKDTDQWELLAVEYARRGYNMNAKRCYERADECLVDSFVTVEYANLD